MSRRSFLHTTTAPVRAVGVVAAAWPLIDQMNPGAPRLLLLEQVLVPQR
jgi:Rieske Fe-S protein